MMGCFVNLISWGKSVIGAQVAVTHSSQEGVGGEFVIFILSGAVTLPLCLNEIMMRPCFSRFIIVSEYLL